MSFWKSLFGGSKSADAVGDPASAKVVREIEHSGFKIQATPYPEAGQYQACGIVSKEVDGTHKEHRFVRADRFATLDEAAEFSITKGRQIVDQSGERIFK